MKMRSVFIIVMTTSSLLVGCNGKALPKQYNVNCEVDGITFSETKVIEGKDYESKIYLDDAKVASGVTLPFFLAKVISGKQSINFYDYTYKLDKDNVVADFRIPSNYIKGDVLIELELIQHKRWYEHEDWWEYCSSGISGEEATVYDIGKEVDLKINDVVHKIRLIDVDKDVDKDGNIIHSTFEFANTMDGVLTSWNTKDPVGQQMNHDFINHSSLNDCLQPKGSAYKKIPYDLMSTIKFVRKHVDVFEKGAWVDKTYDTQLFPLSDIEINGTDEQRYRFYIGADDDRRKKAPATEEAEQYYHYQTRSPYHETGYDVWTIDENGKMKNSGYMSDVSSFRHGVAPVFCI